MRATPKTSSPSRTWGPSCRSRQYGARRRASRRNAAFSGASYLDVLLRTALDLLLGRHVVCGLVGGGIDGDGGRSRFEKFALRLGNFVQRSVTGKLFRRSASAPAELFLSLSLHVSSSFSSRHALTLQHLTAASIQVQYRQHGGQEEHRHHRYGRYGEDVCLALECGRLEVSATLVAWLPRCPGAWDSWVSLSSDFFFTLHLL